MYQYELDMNHTFILFIINTYKVLGQYNKHFRWESLDKAIFLKAMRPEQFNLSILLTGEGCGAKIRKSANGSKYLGWKRLCAILHVTPCHLIFTVIQLLKMIDASASVGWG